MRFRLADIACGHCVALVLDVAFGHLVAKDYRNQLHRIVCQLCGFINVQIQPAYQPFHFYRRIHCRTGHLHYLFSYHDDIVARESRGSDLQCVEYRPGCLLGDRYRLSGCRKALACIIGDRINRLFVLRYPDRFGVKACRRFRREVRDQFGEFQVVVVVVEYVHGQAGESVFTGNRQIAVSVAGNKGQGQVGILSRGVIPGGFAAR